MSQPDTKALAQELFNQLEFAKAFCAKSKREESFEPLVQSLMVRAIEQGIKESKIIPFVP
jgi:hypothetical protein